MRNIVRRCSAALMSALLILTVNIPVYATEIDYVSRDSFWNWIAGSNGIAQKVVGFLSFSGTCAQSEDSYHHASSYEYDTGDGHYGCVCIYCGKVFTAYASDLSAAYDDYVQTLPAPGYSSSNDLRWRLNVNRLETRFSEFASSSVGSSFSVAYLSTTSSSDPPVYIYFDAFIAPISGDHRLAEYFTSSYKSPSKGVEGGTRSYLLSNDRYYLSCYANKSDRFLFGQYYEFPDVHGFTLGQQVVGDCVTYIYGRSNVIEYAGGYVEVICKPAVSVSGDTYNTNTRPTSITGGNYGIIGDNGQITKVEDNSTIINETNNTFYNPATGQTVPIVNWSYDYSDRSYKVTLESGDTATITYGDENITISQITTTEGDTITNNYTIYYLIDGSGSGEICAHEWTETSTTPATCTLPGSKLLTCSKCQQTKKDPLPALGHDWQVKQTVTTQYDDTGQLIQEGYTIYESINEQI